jgi:hypothetical protein
MLNLCNLTIPLPVSQFHQEDNENIDMETTITLVVQNIHVYKRVLSYVISDRNEIMSDKK